MGICCIKPCIEKSNAVYHCLQDLLNCTILVEARSFMTFRKTLNKLMKLQYIKVV